MKISIVVKSNGIHDYAILKVKEVDNRDAEVELVKRLENVVKKYNKENIEKA